jgi:hypothetical protein
MSEEALRLLTGLENPDYRNDALRVANVSPLDDIKANIMQFFRDRIATIKKVDALKERVYEKMGDMLDRDELDFEKMVTMLKMTKDESATAADGILSLFRPAPGTQSLFLEVARPVDKDGEIKDAYKHYTTEELQTIDRVLTHAKEIIQKE